MAMDASASNKVQAADINLRSFYLHIANRGLTTNQKNTTIKYTKLPEYDFDSKVLWPQKNTYILQPHLRRIITLNDEDDILRSSRSLKSEFATPHKLMSSTFSRRKIVSISEDDEKTTERLITRRKAVQTRGTETKSSTKLQKSGRSDVKVSPNRISSRSFIPSKYQNQPENKLSAKSTALSSSKNYNDAKNISRPRSSQSSKALFTSKEGKSQTQDSKNSVSKEGEKSQSYKNTNLTNKSPSNIRKNSIQQSISIQDIKNEISDYKKRKSSAPKISQFSTSNNNIFSKYSRKENLVNNNITKCKGLPVITVPLEHGVKQILETHITHVSIQPIKNNSQVNCSTEVEVKDFFKEISVGTDPAPEQVDVVTEMDCQKIQKKHCDVQTDNFLKSHFDSLDIPNVTLIKDKKYESKENIVKLCSKSLPNLKVPASHITSHEEDEISGSGIISKSKSYIIGRATLTYTTKQKINFHVVSNKDEAVCSTSSSSLAYPMNVVSIFKKDIQKNKEAWATLTEEEIQKDKNETNTQHANQENEHQSLNCSYAFDNNKLMKPSELISTIRLNNGSLQSDYICEQFQRELNFIDSFFESLQYLENCTLSNKSFTDTSVEHWVNKSGFGVKSSEYESLFSKFDNGTDIDDTETMASKSLCLLNLLIRDEQRRAKDLLFVLKMREDALKDFTKSQILWLENKKKHDNIDISTLKKKQRGALLKLQHECGEMQRMRKALLALSEKRKVALIKTKKNIELKLKNNVEPIVLGKKKLKRNSASDRPGIPLKCFDLSSSGCDESTIYRPKSESAIVVYNSVLAPADITIKSAEKSIQTGGNLLTPAHIDETTDTIAENFISVDGGYLNILFNNLCLPEIFSGGKQYEVNEEALRSIVDSANNHKTATKSDIIEKFMDQIKNRDPDRSTTPSTARSLVEELDQYYKGLAEDQSSMNSPEISNAKSFSSEDGVVAEAEPIVMVDENVSQCSIFTMAIDCHSEAQVNNKFDGETVTDDIDANNTKERETMAISTQAGPLPVPAGSVAGTKMDLEPNNLASTTINSSSYGVTSRESSKSVSSQVASVTSLVAPVQSEAEELRRQQLAIEREIKALEQQQCQLLVVREIPDKPPPPYIPPNEPRTPKPARMFSADHTVEEKVRNNLCGKIGTEPTDSLDLFLHDFCQESVDKHKREQGDKPWDACNLLPQKPPLSQEELVNKTTGEVKEVLSGVSPVPVSGVGTRRSDHIDDILFSEWRRYEPEWTALHTDEASVKSQIFEGIFQRILSKTVDEYKKIVHNDSHPSDSN